jgi:Amt family ammonium transporter
MVRKKNVGDTVMTSTITASSAFCGSFSLTALPSSRGRRSSALDRALLQGIVSATSQSISNHNPLAPTIPNRLLDVPTDLRDHHGGADRRLVRRAQKFSAMLWFIGLWAIFVYSPIAHWVWGPDGIFNAANDAAWVKVLDFAGGTVVHVNSGTAGTTALMSASAGHGAPHNMLHLIVASLLWVGWFGSMPAPPYRPACRPAWLCWSLTSPPRPPASPG